MIKCLLSLTPLTPKQLTQIKRPVLPAPEETVSSARARSDRVTKEPGLRFVTIFQSPFDLRGDH